MIFRATQRPALPRSGQTTQYAAGDDGDVWAGWLGTTRFVDCGNGTIYDRATHLIWVKDPRTITPGTSVVASTAGKGTWNAATSYAVGDVVQGDGDPDSYFYVCIQAHQNQEPPNPSYWVQTPWIDSAANPTSPEEYAWADAVAMCSDGAGGGLTWLGVGPWTPTNPGGWRLPNRLELLSLADHENSTIYAAFSGIKTDLSYWSATTRKDMTTYAYYQTFSGRLSNYDAAKTTTYYVLPVRGGRTNG